MSEPTHAVRRATWLVALVSLVFSISGTMIPVALGVDRSISADDGLLILGVAAPVLGLILVLRAGATRMGALLLAMGFGLGLASLGAGLPTTPEYLDWLPLIPFTFAGWMLFLGLTVAGLPLLFPTGRPLTPRWQPVLWSLLVLLPLASLMAVFSENVTLFCSDVYPGDTPCSVWEASDEPIAVDRCEEIDGPLGTGTQCEVQLDNPIGVAGVPSPESGLLGSALYGVLLTLSVLSIASLGLRFRRAGTQERQQIKLVFFVLGLFVAASLVEVVVVDYMGDSLPAIEVIDFLMWVAIPVSIFLAITRYRLYDIDRLISRTLSYGIVVGLLAGVVALVATLIGTRFDDPLVVATTTLGVAALFNPLRRRVQGVVDRRFNRSRYDAERVIDDFVSSLRDRVDIDAVVEDCRRVVTETMQPATVSVWMRP